MTIYEKLSNIQRDLIAPKGQRNDFGKYNYRSCEDIVKALKPLCDREKVTVYMTNELEEVGGRVYVKAIIHFIDLESDTSLTVTAHAREEAEKKGMDGSQITGASSSYARKYALAGLFMIDNEKDSDATNTHGKEESKKTAKQPDDFATHEQIEFISDAFKDKPDNFKKWMQAYAVENPAQLSQKQAADICNKLKALMAKKES